MPDGVRTSSSGWSASDVAAGEVTGALDAAAERLAGSAAARSRSSVAVFDGGTPDPEFGRLRSRGVTNVIRAAGSAGGASIRPLAPTDVDAVVDLSLRAWAPVFESFEATWDQELYDRFWPDWRPQQASSVRDALAANPAWVSTDGDRVTGFVNVVFDEAERAGEIYMIAVDPTAQGRGVASSLTDFALDEMRRRGMTLATVATGADPGHGPARRTYERAGFSPIHQVLYARLL
jgi:ribosomal protein S18 acetylase RimI-like enzyme